ncbi:hypothetical protein ACJMK2_004296 [Sinanodonta woodiana]|uniref:Uncharacterized protein n=1 Tax=Sinanodonta woodiana TaxID=1069815 RepID=A0ABD3Y344_SINWO
MEYQRWIVMLSTYLTEFTSLGLLFAVPVLFVNFLETYRESRAKTATVTSILLGVMGCSGIINGLLVQSIGPRKAGFLAGLLMSGGWMLCFFSSSILYIDLLMAVPTGIGCSIITISTSRTLCQHFKGKPCLIALAVQTTASGTGRIVYTYILTACLESFGLQGLFLIMGALLLNCAILPIIWQTNRVSQQETSPISEETQKALDVKICCTRYGPIFTNKTFLTFLFGIAFLYVPHSGFLIVFTDIMKSREYTEENIRLAYVIHSISNVCGRLSFGFLKQIPRVGFLSLAFLFACMSAVSFATIHLAKEFWTTAFACSFMGFEMGVTVAAISIGVLKIVGPENLPFGMGLILSVIGIGNVVVGPIFGVIRDVTGTYSLSLWISTLSAGVSATLFLMAMIMKHRMN